MDELVIGEKKYISSKRAAEITGYAKDYIGQLCREGRVEARLVGRSWYVLESSIHEHRFGKTQEDSLGADNIQAHDEESSGWESPKYVAEAAKELPELISRPQMKTSLNVRLLSEYNVTPVSDISNNEAKIEPEHLYTPSQGEKEVEDIEANEKQEVPVLLHKIAAKERPQAQEIEVVRTRYVAKRPQKTYPTSQEPIEKGNLIGVSILVATAVISISVMLIGTGVVDHYLLPAASESGFIKFLGGKSFFYR